MNYVSTSYSQSEPDMTGAWAHNISISTQMLSPLICYSVVSESVNSVGEWVYLTVCSQSSLWPGLILRLWQLISRVFFPGWPHTRAHTRARARRGGGCRQVITNPLKGYQEYEAKQQDSDSDNLRCLKMAVMLSSILFCHILDTIRYMHTSLALQYSGQGHRPVPADTVVQAGSVHREDLYMDLVETVTGEMTLTGVLDVKNVSSGRKLITFHLGKHQGINRLHRSVRLPQSSCALYAIPYSNA